MKKEDVKDNVKEPWTTVLGLLLVILVPILGFFGVVTPEQGELVQTKLQALVEAIQNNQLWTIVNTLFGLVMIFFTKLGKK